MDERHVNRITRLEVDVAVLKSDHVSIKNDVRQIRSRQDQTFYGVMATLVTLLTSGLGFVVWQVITHGLRTP